VVVCVSVLQRVAVFREYMHRAKGTPRPAVVGRTLGVLQCVAVCCSVLQCDAVCCSVLQYFENTCKEHEAHLVYDPAVVGGMFGMLQCVAVCCSVLQCVAVHCSVLQCVAACYSISRIHAKNRRHT